MFLSTKIQKSKTFHMDKEIKIVIVAGILIVGGYYLYRRYENNRFVEKMKDEEMKGQEPNIPAATPSQPISATISNPTDGNITGTNAQVFAAPTVLSGQNAV